MAEIKNKSNLSEYAIVAGLLLAMGGLTYVSTTHEIPNDKKENRIMTQREFIEALNNPVKSKSDTSHSQTQVMRLMRSKTLQNA